ncbi:MAG: alpha/beta hydrolase [Erysipelotrichaceae bacterium]
MGLIKKMIFREFRSPHRSNGKSLAESKFKKPYSAEEFFLDGHRVTTIERSNFNQHHILFFHGGAYACDASYMHRLMVQRFVDDGFRVTFFDYPMIPEHTASFTNRWVIDAYQKLVLKYPDDTYVIFGDSAGGGLSLVFRMLIRDQKITPVPQNSVLASPWLDVSMSNPDILHLSDLDKVLPLDGLIWAGERYAGELGVKNPYVSPIYGNLDDLGDILLFYSTREMLVPDCERFIELAKQAEATTVSSEVCDGLFHDYLLTIHTKAAKHAFRRITAFYLQEH